MLARITKRHKAAALLAGMGMAALGYLAAAKIASSAALPTIVVEALPVSEWGFGTLPRGTVYYVQPRVTCTGAHGQSYRLGVVRLVTGIQYFSGLSFPPLHTPPGAR